MKNLLIILSLSALACGIQTVPNKSTANMREVSTFVNTPAEYPLMVVTAVEALNYRVCAGDGCDVIDQLKPNEVVTCYEFVTVGDSVWCRHDKGWSNTSYMKGK